MRTGTLRAALFSLAAIGMLICGTASGHAQEEHKISATTIPAAALIQPAELNKLLQGPASARPLVLQVGFQMMYREAHITGAEYAGPAANAGGLKVLRDRVQALPHNKFIVIYCGCCPWTKCPNIGAAYKELHAMGYTNVKALHLADNFGANWVSRGYATARGQ